MLRRWRILSLLLCGAAMAGHCDEVAAAPVSLVITYTAASKDRASFRAWFLSAGTRQFASWKHQGVFRDCQILWSAYAGSGPFDAAVVLTFPSLAETGAWRRIEADHPGGLDGSAPASAGVVSSALCDCVAGLEPTVGDHPDATYVIAVYRTSVDNARYETYVNGYVVPQLKGWKRAGILNSYRMYVTENPGVPYDAMLVLEYRGMEALGQRDRVKAEVRKQLSASDPAWKAFSLDKTSIRTEVATLFADALPVPQRR